MQCTSPCIESSANAPITLIVNLVSVTFRGELVPATANGTVHAFFTNSGESTADTAPARRRPRRGHCSCTRACTVGECAAEHRARSRPRRHMSHVINRDIPVYSQSKGRVRTSD